MQVAAPSSAASSGKDPKKSFPRPLAVARESRSQGTRSEAVPIEIGNPLLPQPLLGDACLFIGSSGCSWEPNLGLSRSSVGDIASRGSTSLLLLTAHPVLFPSYPPESPKALALAQEVRTMMEKGALEVEDLSLIHI